MPSRNGAMERRHAHLVERNRVAIGATLEQQPGHLQPVEVGRQVQWGEAIAAALVDGGAVACQELPHRGHVPDGRRVEDVQAVEHLRESLGQTLRQTRVTGVRRRQYRREPGLVSSSEQALIRGYRFIDRLLVATAHDLEERRGGPAPIEHVSSLTIESACAPRSAWSFPGAPGRGALSRWA